MRTIISGTRLGQYEVVSPLGSGGMGDVYRARDTRLDREVAVKVLPEDFARDPDRVARFQREAKTLASLNHPHIAVIYDFQESGGVSYLVLELVEGETLAQRISRGAIPPEEAIAIAIQIADALEAAHEKSIVHRDLKPANIKITPDGVVKVLDFGVARWTQTGFDPTDMSNSPTIGANATVAGVIMGTAAYMSPEQARGRTVDQRTDIWAFGCVLYEMLTGKQTFSGEDVTDIIASVVKGEPDWNRLPETTPSNLRLLLRRCLDKKPKDRLRDIADARILLQEIRNEPPATWAAQASTTRQPGWAMGALVVSLAVVVILAGALLFRKPALANRSTTRSLFNVEPADSLGSRPPRTALAFSPDGQTVVYAAVKGDAVKLYRRPMDQLMGVPIEGTDDGQNPFFSPDGQTVGFWAKGKLKKVPLNGGPVVDICDVSSAIWGATWGPGGMILFGDVDGSLKQVSPDAGTPQVLLAQNKTQHEDYQLPRFLPGGKAILLTIATKSNKWEDAQVAIYVLATRELRVLISRSAADGRYVPSGHLVYMTAGKLMAVPFALSSLQVTGPPVALIDDLMQAIYTTFSVNETWAGQFDISNTGDLLYARGGTYPLLKGQLVWVDHRGQTTPIDLEVNVFAKPRISPNGQKLVLDRETENGRGDIWVYDIARKIPTKLTSNDQTNWPIWSLDGNRIVFAIQGPTGSDIVYSVPVDGGPVQTIIDHEPGVFAAAEMPIGNQLLYFQWVYSMPAELWLFPMSGDRKAATFVLKPGSSSTSITHPEFSPDGRFLAYVSTESGKNEVYIQPFPLNGEKTRVSTDRGREPSWSRDGHELYYTRVDSKKTQMWEVDVRAGNPGSPHLLFEGDYTQTSPLRNYDVTDDGRFVMVQRVESTDKPVTHLVLVQNWFDELKRRVPSGR